MTVGGAASFSAGGGNSEIILGDGTLANFGSLSLAAADATVTESSSTLFNAVSVRSLRLTSAGAISDSTDIEVTGAAVFDAGTSPITLGDRAGDRTNFGSVELIGGRTTVTEDSSTLLRGANVGRLRYNSAGKIVIDGNAVKALGPLALTAASDIQVRDMPWLGAGKSEVVAGDIVLNAGGVIKIADGAVLESATGKVTNAPPLLKIGELDPDDTIVPGDPTQDLKGRVGGIRSQGDNLEQGANFTVAVLWDDGIRSELAGVSAGDNVVWYVRANGSSHAVITPGSRTGPATIVIVRQYSVDYLTRVNTTEMTASIEVRNDSGIRLNDSSAVELNRTHSSVVSRVSSQETPEKEAPEEASQMSISAAFEDRERAEAALPALLAAEVNTPPPVQRTVTEDISRSQDRLEEQLRQVYLVRIVKAGPDKEETEEDKQLLPESVLRDLTELLENLRKKGLPNGLYRLYLKERGLPRRQVLEFYKWGDTIGDPVREEGRGSKPLSDEGASNRTRDVFSPATAWLPDGRRGAFGQAAAVLFPSVERGSDADERGGLLTAPPEDDGKLAAQCAHGLPSVGHEAAPPNGRAAAEGDWTTSINRAMQLADDDSFSKSARLCRRLRR